MENSNSNKMKINEKEFNIFEEKDRIELKKALFDKERKELDKAIIQEALLRYIDFYLLDEKKYKNINKRFDKIKKLLKKSIFSDKKTDDIMRIIESKKREVIKETENKGKKTVKKFSFKTIQDINEELTKEENHIFEEYGRKIKEEEERKRGEEKWKRKFKDYIEEELEKNKANAKQFNSENIKVTKSTISFVTDLHGDNSSLGISLIQTGFIKSFNKESVVYDVKNNRFLSKEEFENLRQNPNISFEEFIEQYVIIPDFEIPDDIPDSFFVNGGDMNDRGDESAENYVMMIRVRQKYGEKLRNSGYSEDEIKQKLNEKFPMALGDHELYYTSLLNEEKNIKNKAEKKALEELKKDYSKEDEKDLKEKYEKEFEEYKNRYYDIYKAEFEKTHKIINSMQKDGAITFGGSVGDTNTFCFHSCPDANSVALLVMAAIFPYNKELFDKIDSRINKDVIENLQDKLKGNIKNKEIFDKIKVNLFKSVLGKDIKADDITDEDLKELCEKFLEQNKDKSLNDIFINLRRCIGIPTNEEEYKEERSLKAKESLKIYSEIGSNLDLQINGKDNPLLILTTFRDSFTNREKGFLDSRNLDGNGVSSALMHGLAEEGVDIVVGHTGFEVIENQFFNEELDEIIKKKAEKKVEEDIKNGTCSNDKISKNIIIGRYILFNEKNRKKELLIIKKKTEEEAKEYAQEIVISDLKKELIAKLRKEEKLKWNEKISKEDEEIINKNIEEKVKSGKFKFETNEKYKKIMEDYEKYKEVRKKTEEKIKEIKEIMKKNRIYFNDNNVSKFYRNGESSRTSVMQIDEFGNTIITGYEKMENGIRKLKDEELGFIPTKCIEDTKEQTQESEEEQKFDEKKFSKSMKGMINELTQEIKIG